MVELLTKNKPLWYNKLKFGTVACACIDTSRRRFTLRQPRRRIKKTTLVRNADKKKNLSLTHCVQLRFLLAERGIRSWFLPDVSDIIFCYVVQKSSVTVPKQPFRLFCSLRSNPCLYSQQSKNGTPFGVPSCFGGERGIQNPTCSESFVLSRCISPRTWRQCLRHWRGVLHRIVSL